MELYYGIILMRRITGIPGEPLEPGPPWDLLGLRKHALDAPRTLGSPLGPPGDPSRTPWGLSDTPMDHKTGHISTSVQRQKLSIT